MGQLGWERKERKKGIKVGVELRKNAYSWLPPTSPNPAPG